MFCDKMPKVRCLWTALLLVFLAALFIFIATAIVNAIEYWNSDFFTFWLSGRLVSEGQNP